ncbi:MAG: sigma-70 family RNA polymerase sigma factor [Planctomycetes bacterium]|nr:sigma-70 family RNA polymerase sigma factor [Planctomycetota bacterium]
MTEQEPMETLARRAAAGDRQAFEELVGACEPRVAALARDLLGKRARQYVEVADIVQETFAKAFQHIDRLVWRGDEAFLGWLSSIARNVVLSAVQKVQRAPLQLQRDVPDSGASPSKNLRRQERFERLQKAIDALPPQYRQVIVLARMEKLEVKEIAARMNRSPNAVKKLLARALQELKKDFGDTESLHLPDQNLEATGGGHGR